jgi:hypothetical protein
LTNPIDLFIRAKGAEKNLSPSTEADKRTLLRRVSFDLIGLPPTPEEMRAFLADDSQQAYERVVDRLLASPRYGERWARHWMDAAHFAETHGHDQDRIRTNAWPYRDYLIASFNADKPYTRFVQEQVAGDVCLLMTRRRRSRWASWRRVRGMRVHCATSARTRLTDRLAGTSIAMTW